MRAVSSNETDERESSGPTPNTATRLWRWVSVAVGANSDRVINFPKSNPAGRLIKPLGGAKRL